MDLKPISITIPIPIKKISNTKKTKNCNLEGQIELKNECLKYFYGCWVKCINKKNGEYNSGGFLTSLSSSIVKLRSLKSQNLLEFNIDEYCFFVKQNSEQYISMQEIELEKERLNIESTILKNKRINLNNFEKILINNNKKFKNEKNIFNKVKEKFLKLFTDGKVKILI